MPLPTPFHSRTSPICKNQEWRNWSGFLAAVTYAPSHEHEYFSIRNSAGLIDVSPLYKYEFKGPDAVRLANRAMTRNISQCKPGQIMYSPWCDENGKVIDDGTVSRIGPQHVRVTAADPSLRWFQDVGYGLDVTVDDVSGELAALAIQGPNSRQILKQLVSGLDLDQLRYYWLAQGKIGDFSATITRTGYTGDLGFEIWVEPKHAEKLWDILMETGVNFGITPCGLAALDIARIEAGLLLIDVDYISSNKAVLEEQKSSPFEIGLGWTVDLAKEDFIGKKALIQEKKHGSKWRFIGLEIDWNSLETVYGKVNLPPQVAGRASRNSLPIYKNGRQIGQATSIAFSPLLKKYIALATVLTDYSSLGTLLNIEVTVEHHREIASAKVVDSQFYNPPWKRDLPNVTKI